MDNFTLKCLAETCCPSLFRNFAGVASADNFFCLRDFEQLIDSAAAAGGEIFSYQIVNSAKQNEIGQHWLLLLYILIHDKKKRPSNKVMMMVFIWDPLGSPIKNYKILNKRLASLSSEMIKLFEINFPLQNPSSNLCGLYCLFMAHYLKEIQFADNVSTLLRSKRKNFIPNIQCFVNRSLAKLTNVSEIEVIRYFNIHCKCNFGYKICYNDLYSNE